MFLTSEVKLINNLDITMKGFVLFVSLVFSFALAPASAQQFLSRWSSGESQETVPCYGQEMTNGSFHVGRKLYTSEEIYIYYQIFEGNSNNNLDCTFNGAGAGNDMGFGRTPYTWTIDSIDIVSSGGMDCLGGGVGYPWYRFRLYGSSYTEYEASVWVTWRGPSMQLRTNPAYLVHCVYTGTTRTAIPVNNPLNPFPQY